MFRHFSVFSVAKVAVIRVGLLCLSPSIESLQKCDRIECSLFVFRSCARRNTHTHTDDGDDNKRRVLKLRALKTANGANSCRPWGKLHGHVIVAKVSFLTLTEPVPRQVLNLKKKKESSAGEGGCGAFHARLCAFPCSISALNKRIEEKRCPLCVPDAPHQRPSTIKKITPEDNAAERTTQCLLAPDPWIL